MAYDEKATDEARSSQFNQEKREVERMLGHNQTTAPLNVASFSERINLANVDEAFQYQPWDAQQCAAGDQVREALVAAVKTILRTVPDGPLRTRAINNIVDARMIANAAITFRGRF